MGTTFAQPLKVIRKRTAGDGQTGEEVEDADEWCEQLGQEYFDIFKAAYDQAPGETRDAINQAVGGEQNIATSQAFQDHLVDLEPAEKDQLMRRINEIIASN